MPTDIEWTDETWNPTRGCSRVSPGCDNCYAMGQAHRFNTPEVLTKPDPVTGHVELEKRAGAYHGLTVYREGGKRPGVDWSGKVRLVPEMLEVPRRWKRPRRIFVNSMSDLFHESLDNEQIAAVFGAMATAPHHTFQILTKRPKRMREWFTWLERTAGDHGYARLAYCLRAEGDHSRIGIPWVDERLRQLITDDAGWPLPNVMLGVSVESADYLHRLDDLLWTPAERRFVSLEPLLGDVPGLRKYLDIGAICECKEIGNPVGSRCEGRGSAGWIRCNAGMRRLNWVIVGLESGNGARAGHVEWVESIVKQCRSVLSNWKGGRVACFVKQLGRVPLREDSNGLEWSLGLKHRKGADMSEWPEHLRVREFPA